MASGLESKTRRTDSVFYEVEGVDREYLEHETLDACVYAFLNSINIHQIPSHINVTVYTRMRFSTLTLNPLEQVLEELEEEHGCPDSMRDYEPSPRMIQAEDAFLRVIQEEYAPWNSESVGMIHVDVAKWLERFARKLARGYPDFRHSGHYWVANMQWCLERETT